MWAGDQQGPVCVCLGGLCHQWAWEVFKSVYQVWGLGRESGEATLGLGLAFNLGVAGTFFPPDDFCGVAWD